jgi:type IX secretion system PorP/SprF family membrane protein
MARIFTLYKSFWWIGSFLLLIFMSAPTQAQDPQFSQFYANPLYLNPGLAGNVESARVGVNFRHQWPGIDASFTTYTAFLDYFLEDYNSGIGVLLMRDQQGLAGLNSHSLNLNYAYQLSLTDKLTFRPGVSVGVIQRSINRSKLQFADQFNGTGFNPISQTGEDLSGLRPIYQFDLGLGGVLYIPNAYLGASVSHITEPTYSFFEDEEQNTYLPMKLSVHGGYVFYLQADNLRRGFDQFGRERSITPTFEYKMQGNFKQLSLGAYLTYEPMVFGLWYRGLPIGGLAEVDNNHESAIFLVGLKSGNLNVGYSFDYTLSSLTIQSGGAHEVSAIYNFRLGNSRKPPMNVRRIPCPEF